jgi:dTMP kinase
MSGLFVTFEGVEGCGKSTQARRIEAHLKAQGRAVLLTREPGGTPIAEAIRGVLLDPVNIAMSPVTELLLYEAARAQHVAERIQPALEQGVIVVCDRFADSTTAYQGAGRALPAENVQHLHHLATAGTTPDLTILLDVPVEEGLARAGRLNGPDRLEAEPVTFHRKVREEFLRIAERDPGRVKVLDGLQPPDDIASDVLRLVEERLEHR